MNKKLIGVVFSIICALSFVNAQAAFLGRDANGSPNSSCGNACALYYDTSLNITILNASIGLNSYSDTLTLASQLGFNTTGLTGWTIPTANAFPVAYPAGPDNMYLSIWNDVGASDVGMRNQFAYADLGGWSSSHYNACQGMWCWMYSPTLDITFHSGTFGTLDPGVQYFGIDYFYLNDTAMVIRAGDVAPPVTPIPATAWLLISSIGGLGLFARKRKQV